MAALTSGMPSSIISGMASNITPSTEKVRENRLRRMAERQRLAVVKSRRRDPRAADYGFYMIVDPYTTGVVAGAGPAGPSMTLDEVEAYLTDDDGADES